MFIKFTPGEQKHGLDRNILTPWHSNVIKILRVFQVDIIFYNIAFGRQYTFLPFVIPYRQFEYNKKMISFAKINIEVQHCLCIRVKY